MPTVTTVPVTRDGSDARADRWELRRAVWRVSKVKKLQTCGRAVRDDAVTLLVTTNGDERRAAAHGLVTCSSIWACPVCSAHIRQERASDLEAGLAKHRAQGGGALLVTLTLRHEREDGLKDLLGALRTSWRRIQQSRAWKGELEALGVRGWVRAIEITYGENGWHPHLHVLLLTAAEPTHGVRDRLSNWLTRRWLTQTAKHGFEGLPGIAVDVRRVADDPSAFERLAGYATKGEHSHLELARADLKGGHRPLSYSCWDLLAWAHEGEAWALHRWWEYEQATHRARAIEWSRGLREDLGLGKEREDGEITADKEADDAETVEEVATLTEREWLTLCRAHLDYEAVKASLDGEPAVAAVLDAARYVLESDRRDQIRVHGLRPG